MDPKQTTGEKMTGKVTGKATGKTLTDKSVKPTKTGKSAKSASGMERDDMVRLRSIAMSRTLSTKKRILLSEGEMTSVTLLCLVRPDSPDALTAKLLSSSMPEVRAFAAEPEDIETSLAGFKDAFDQPLILSGEAGVLLGVVSWLQKRLDSAQLALVAMVVLGDEDQAGKVRKRGLKQGPSPVAVVAVDPGTIQDGNRELTQSMWEKVNAEFIKLQVDTGAVVTAYNAEQVAEKVAPWTEQWSLALNGAGSTPPATVDDESSWTLPELHEFGTKMAQLLRRRNCAGGRVAIYMEKNATCCAVAVGCLLCDTTFIDVASWHTGSDLERVLRVAHPDLIVTTSELRLNLPQGLQAQALLISEVEAQEEGDVSEVAAPPQRGGFFCCAQQAPREARQKALTSSSADAGASPSARGAFCVLTSGSTGVSKVLHCPEAALTDSMPVFEDILRPGDRVGSFWLYYYFMCVMLRKCTMVPIPDPVIADGTRLVEYVRKHDISVLFLTPTFLDGCLKNVERSELSSAFAKVHTVMLTGEGLRDELRAAFREALPKARLVNIYSINETGDLALEIPEAIKTYRLRQGVRAEILDHGGRPVLQGTVGSLHVRTRALCTEYWSDDGAVTLPADQAFPTGDLVRWLGDGRLSFVRRAADAHVKIRGFKVNPGVVEGVLIQHPQVSFAICIATGDHDQEARLEAAVRLIAADGGGDGGVPAAPLTERQLREWLNNRLPRYMIPAVFHELGGDSDTLKNTGTGKTRAIRAKTAADLFKRLPMLGAAAAPQGVRLSGKEAVVADAWRTVLHLPLPDLRPDDSFFDFGGSLLLVELTKVLEELSSTRPTIAALLEDPTVAGMARTLDSSSGGGPKFDPKAQAVKFTLDTNVDVKVPPETVLDDYRRKPKKSIFLTGATGFLGVYVMRSLCRRPEVETVFCLVRAADDERATARLRRTCQTRRMKLGGADGSWFSKVVVVCGDLSSPGLGIAGDDRHRLVGSVDMVAHIGAEVNWVKPYASMVDSNVGGTKGALELAAEAHAAHLFASSITASAGPDQFQTGYRQGKEVSEILCARAVEELDVPSAVMRFGDIGAAEEAIAAGEVGTLPEDDFMMILLRACATLGIYPDVPWAISIMSVAGLADFVSEAIVSAPASEFVSTPRDIKSKLVSWRQMWLWIGDLLPVQKCPVDDWKAALADAATQGVEIVIRLLLVLPMVEGYLAHEGKRFEAGEGAEEELPSIDAAWAQGVASIIAKEVSPPPAKAPCCCAIS